MGHIRFILLENIIYQNDKEGMCLDYGTFGAYVSNNIVKENGGRLRQSDEDLEADFVTAFWTSVRRFVTGKASGYFH